MRPRAVGFRCRQTKEGTRYISFLLVSNLFIQRGQKWTKSALVKKSKKVRVYPIYCLLLGLSLLLNFC